MSFCDLKSGEHRIKWSGEWKGSILLQVQYETGWVELKFTKHLPLW